MEQKHTDTLLKIMLERGEVTAAEVFGISNPNAYFCELVKLGLCVSKWVVKNGSRFKMRSIPPDKRKEAKNRVYNLGR
jgi:hypothetical protein